MAVCLITEGVLNQMDMSVMWPGATQSVTYTASTQSVALGDNTSLIRVIADADVFLAFGANPTATAVAVRVPANTVEYFAVQPGIEVACYDGTT